MDLEELIELSTNFYYDQPYIVIGIIAVLMILLFLKPKQFFKFMIILLLVGAVFYIFSFISEATFTGILEKRKMVK